MRSLPLLALSFAACGGGYQQDSYRTGLLAGDHKFEGTRLTHGCLDIALRAQDSLEGDPTLDVTLGNRCVKAQRVHIERLKIRGYFEDRTPVLLSFYDPVDEIHSALLGGKAAAHERLEVAGGYGAYQLCVSVDAILGEASGPPSETCLPVQPSDEAQVGS